jgi:hypothetical protein
MIRAASRLKIRDIAARTIELDRKNQPEKGILT